MNPADLIKQRLEVLGYEQRDLAVAAAVTESYISQLLRGKKALPSPNRSDIYDKVETFLKLSAGELARLVELERKEDLKRKIGEPSGPLFQEIRELILKKCRPGRADKMRSTFEKEPFGEIERLITQKLLDVAKGVANEEWKNESWLRLAARINHKSYEEMRVIVLEFLDTDIFNLSVPNFVYFLAPLIESWDIDPVSFSMKVTLASGLGRERIKRFEFVEKELESSISDEAGLKDFLQDTGMSQDITQDEIAFLKRLRFPNKNPTKLYYYRELQNLRDPLHFEPKAPL